MRGSGGSMERGRMSWARVRNQLVSTRAESMCCLWWLWRYPATRDQGTRYSIKLNPHFESDKDELLYSLTIRRALCLLKMSWLSGWRGGCLLFMSQAGSTFHCFYWLGNQDRGREAEVVKGQWLLPGHGMWSVIGLGWIQIIISRERYNEFSGDDSLWWKTSTKNVAFITSS